MKAQCRPAMPEELFFGLELLLTWGSWDSSMNSIVLDAPLPGFHLLYFLVRWRNIERGMPVVRSWRCKTCWWIPPEITWFCRTANARGWHSPWGRDGCISHGHRASLWHRSPQGPAGTEALSASIPSKLCLKCGCVAITKTGIPYYRFQKALEILQRYHSVCHLHLGMHHLHLMCTCAELLVLRQLPTLSCFLHRTDWPFYSQIQFKRACACFLSQDLALWWLPSRKTIKKSNLEVSLPLA